MKKCAQVHRFHFNGILFVCRRCGWWKRGPDDVPQAPPNGDAQSQGADQ